MRKPHPRTTQQSRATSDADNAIIEIITPIESFGDGNCIRTNPSSLKAALLDDKDLLSLVKTAIKAPIEARVEIEPTRVREYVTIKRDDRQSLIEDGHDAAVEGRRILHNNLAKLRTVSHADAMIGQAFDPSLVQAVARVKQKLKAGSIVQSGGVEIDFNSCTLREVRKESREEVEYDCEISGWLESNDPRGSRNSAGKLVARIKGKKMKEIYVSVPETARAEVIQFLLRRTPARIVITAVGLVSTAHNSFELADDGHALCSLQCQPNQLLNDDQDKPTGNSG